MNLIPPLLSSQGLETYLPAVIDVVQTAAYAFQPLTEAKPLVGFFVLTAGLKYVADNQAKKEKAKNCIKFINLKKFKNLPQCRSDLETLPEEMNVRIVSFLSLKDMRTLQSLNQYWYRLCQDRKILEKLISDQVPAPIIGLFGTGKDILKMPLFTLKSRQTKKTEEVNKEQFSNLVYAQQHAKNGKNQEKEWRASSVTKPNLSFQLPPSFWPKVKGINTPSDSPLITFINHHDLEQESVIRFVDDAKRWGFAFHYECTYKNQQDWFHKTVKGVAVLHQAYPSKDAPWIWVDNIDINMNWRIHNPDEADIVKTDKCSSKDHPHRWFLFFHDESAPDWKIHEDWLKKFLSGETCLWLKEGQKYEFAKIKLLNINRGKNDSTQ